METQAARLEAVAEQGRRIQENLQGVRERIVVFSGKGGVGKTTVAVNLAFALAKKGNRVGLLDADVTGPDVPKMVGLLGKPTKGEPGFMVPPEREGVKVISIASLIPEDSPVIWRGPLRSRALDQFLGEVAWGSLDHLVADLPPGTGDEVMTMAQHMKPQLAVVVTTPQEMSLIDCRRAINMATKMGVERIGVVENMSGLRCPKCDHLIEIFGSGGGKQVASELGVVFLGSLPMDLNVREQADRGTPVMLSDEPTDIHRAFVEITRRVMEMMEGD
jgi:ATP-binding protein involved in chromosome partitioning